MKQFIKDFIEGFNDSGQSWGMFFGGVLRIAFMILTLAAPSIWIWKHL